MQERKNVAEMTSLQNVHSNLTEPVIVKNNSEESPIDLNGQLPQQQQQQPQQTSTAPNSNTTTIVDEPNQASLSLGGVTFPLTSIREEITTVLSQKKMNLMNSPTVIEAIRNIQNSQNSSSTSPSN